MASVAILLLGSYATLFSAFWPNTGIWVCGTYDSYEVNIDTTGTTDTRYTGCGYSLQVFRVVLDTHDRILRHCELGRMAIL